MSSLDIVVETPKGSAQKYDYDRKTQFFKMSKILPSGMVFPYDFGFIPGTKGEDGDPLDVMLISEFRSFPGCLMECRIVGGFEAEQSVEAGRKKMIRNDRFLAVPVCSNMFAKVDSVEDFPKHIVRELEDFFIEYNRVQGKEFKVLAKLKAKEALHLIKEGEKK